MYVQNEMFLEQIKMKIVYLNKRKSKLLQDFAKTSVDMQQILRLKKVSI